MDTHQTNDNKERSIKDIEPSVLPPTHFSAPQAYLNRLERTLERGLSLEHGANIFPLLHIVFYYLILFALACGWVKSLLLKIPLWVLLVLLNYSLSIGILHLHAHRKLFTKRLPNRLVEALLCIPCGLSYPLMLYVHVYLHHRYEDEEGDPTSTKGKETGLRAVWYWLSYPHICHKATIAGLFGHKVAPTWKRLRLQYIVDTSTVFVIMLTWGMADFAEMLLYYALPLLIVSVNIGFFAWLTHAPAEQGPINGSINTTSSWMNLLIHNQGFHTVHHQHPSLHWTLLPDRLDIMHSVDDELIVPYWVTLDSALRIFRPRSFRNASHGRLWKERYSKLIAQGRHRLSCLPYFSWIR